MTTTAYRFQGFVLEPSTRTLAAGDGGAIALTPKAFDILVYLVEHHERVVGKDELLEQVWPGRVVEENNLNQAVSAIRRALGVNASDHRFVVTLPGHGYRFVETVLVETREPVPGTGMDDVAPRKDAPTTAPPDSKTGRHAQVRRRVAFVAALLVVVALSAILLHRRFAMKPPALATDATLAVLPFRSLSVGARDELLGLGIADTLISRIGNSSGLRVRSLASSQHFIDGDIDPLQAARQLGADYVLEGSTQRSGDMVRVGARLRAVGDGTVLWSDSFDERMDRVFTLQDRIADALNDTLRVRFAAVVDASPCDGANVQAYRAYLTGQYLLNRPSADSMRQAVVAFGRAIDLDPTCARAYAGLAYAHRALVMTADRAPNREFPLAKAAVQRALAINPNLAEAYASRGFIQFWYDWDWAGSEASFKRAIRLNPSLAEAHFGYAHLLRNTGRGREAAVQAQQAIALDPLSPLIGTLGAFFMITGGQHEDGQRVLDGVLQRNPDFWTAWLVHGQMRLKKGDFSGGIAELERASRLCGNCSQALAVLGRTYAMGGRTKQARQVLAQMQVKRMTEYVPATSLATVSNALGETGQALDLLEIAYQERDVRMAFLKTDAAGWEALRSEPRFEALMTKMRFPDTPRDQRVQPTDTDQVRGAP